MVPLRWRGAPSRSPSGRAVARASTATTCAACLTAFPTTPYPPSARCRPRYFAGTPVLPLDRYAMIFDSHGVPIWWYHAPGRPRVLPSGNILWFDRRASSRYEIHRLDGSLVRTLNTAGGQRQRPRPADLATATTWSGRIRQADHVDTSAYGGSATPTFERRATGGELRGPAPLGLEEPGPHLAWRKRDAGGRGSSHESRGLRHRPLELDRARRQLGDRLLPTPRRRLQDQQEHRRIVWKLGGTTTPQSLDREGRPQRTRSAPNTTPASSPTAP